MIPKRHRSFGHRARRADNIQSTLPALFLYQAALWWRPRSGGETTPTLFAIAISDILPTSLSQGLLVHLAHKEDLLWEDFVAPVRRSASPAGDGVAGC